jgi:hypothetical protein
MNELPVPASSRAALGACNWVEAAFRCDRLKVWVGRIQTVSFA